MDNKVGIPLQVGQVWKSEHGRYEREIILIGEGGTYVTRVLTEFCKGFLESWDNGHPCHTLVSEVKERSIYKMKIHETLTMKDTDTSILRVPGGWIYTQFVPYDSHNNTEYRATSVFVPRTD
ncbi:MAG: hypothetical protein DRH97_06100, partial [Chloroflexi bacterium]